MKIILKTSYPCLIKSQTQNCELNENDNLMIENESELIVYPLNNHQIPFIINLKILKENEFYSVFSHNEKTIILLEETPKLCVTHKEKLVIDGKNCFVNVSKKNFSFETETQKIEYRCPSSYKNFNVFKIKHFACIQFDDEHLFIYSLNNNKLSYVNGEISLKDENLSVIKNFNDSENRERKTLYKFEEDVTVEKEEFIRNSNIAIKELSPYKLLESIKAKDYEFALDCLSESLKAKINKEQIKDFFGSIQTFLPLSTTEFITIAGNKKNYVKFNLSENKIDDITVDSL